jgi:hypothetical protein
MEEEMRGLPMLQNVVNVLVAGLPIGRARVYARHVSDGRFTEEQDLAIHLSHDGEESLLLRAKVYHGREPHYAPWVELFSVNPPGDSYFGSDVEDALMEVLSYHIPAGGSVFVEYHEDLETKLCLERGYPPPVTRLGCELLRWRFTWFKDWYFPEGYWEGGQKLQAEKPLMDADRSRHLLAIAGQAREFLDRVASRKNHPWYAREAIKRAQELACRRGVAV